MIMPKPLLPGDCVGLIAPASPIREQEHKACVIALEHMGYTVIEGESLKQNASRYGYLAGDAKTRAKDVNDMFANRQIKGIFCTRGGYGSMELLDYLDYECIASNPKVFIGYSDITCLHAAFGKKCGFITFHGPMVKPNLLLEGDILKYNVDSLQNVLSLRDSLKVDFKNPSGEEIQLLVQGKKVETKKLEGKLFGGNLSVLARLLGTPYSPVGNGEILFLEDIGEPVSKIHMYLEQMRYAGMFADIKCILLGEFTGCTNEKYDKSLKIHTFFQEWFAPLGIPVLSNICSDHRRCMGTLPLGAMCRVTINDRKIVFYIDNF